MRNFTLQKQIVTSVKVCVFTEGNGVCFQEGIDFYKTADVEETQSIPIRGM